MHALTADPAHEVGFVGEEQRGPARTPLEPEVEGVGGWATAARIGGTDALHVLAYEQHRVGERERVGDHDAGGHEHDPAARQLVHEPAETNASGHPAARTIAPVTHWWAASSMGPAITPAPMIRIATGRIVT